MPFAATEKRVLMPVVGEAVAAGKHYDLDGGLAGLDYTNGYLARHTAWRVYCGRYVVPNSSSRSFECAPSQPTTRS